MKYFSRVALTATSAVWILLLVSSNPAQVPRTEKPGDIVTVDTDLVVTWAQITRRDDRSPVRGLRPEDLLLREEGKQQPISLVNQDQPLSVVILVDGMRCVWPAAYEFVRARQALKQLGDDAEFALMGWDSDAVLVQGLTTDRNLIEGPLGQKTKFFYALNPRDRTPSVVRPERDLYRPGEAIYQAAEYLEKTAAADRRKIIITIASKPAPLTMAKTHPHTAAQVEELLGRTGAIVYALYLSDQRPGHGWPLISGHGLRPNKRLSGGTLEEFAELTGGAVLVGNVEEPDEWLIKLAGLIRSGYTIGYYPVNKDFDGRFRQIRLELSEDGKRKTGKVDIRSGNGYRALRLASERKPGP